MEPRINPGRQVERPARPTWKYTLKVVIVSIVFWTTSGVAITFSLGSLCVAGSVTPGDGDGLEDLARGLYRLMAVAGIACAIAGAVGGLIVGRIRPRD